MSSFGEGRRRHRSIRERRLVAASCASKKEGTFGGTGWRPVDVEVQRPPPHKHLNVQMDRESIGVPFALPAGRRGGPPGDSQPALESPPPTVADEDSPLFRSVQNGDEPLAADG